MTVKGLLACVSLSVLVAAACSSDDGKKAVRSEDAGAAGESMDPNAGGTNMMADAGESAGGASGAGGAGGVAGEPTSDAGAAGAIDVAGQGGVAGAGGASAGALTLEDLKGSWTGHLLSTYVCESDVEDIELTIDGSAIVSNWPSPEDGAVGGLLQQSGQSFTFTLFIDNPSFNQDYIGQLYVDASGQYAIFVALAQFGAEGVANTADIAILQKADAAPLDAAKADFLGDWSGVGFSLNDQLAIIQQDPSTASFENGEVMSLSGEDNAGAFIADSVEEASFANGAWIAAGVAQDPNVFGGMFLMSDDKRFIAAALIQDQDPDDGALCQLDDPFADMSVHKFALWTKITD